MKYKRCKWCRCMIADHADVFCSKECARAHYKANGLAGTEALGVVEDIKKAFDG